MLAINNPMMSSAVGYLSMYVGPMYSGKTSKILDLYKQFQFCNVKTAVINFGEDTRYSETMLSTHDKTMIECIMCKTLTEEFPIGTLWGNAKIANIDVFLINEGQFFPDIVEWVKTAISSPYNKRVYICGLDGDFKRNPFGNWLDLIAHSDEVHKLTSICHTCRNKPAIFSHRITNETQQKVIGSDAYIPLCRGCYEKVNIEDGA